MKTRLGGFLSGFATASSPWRPRGQAYPALQAFDLKNVAGQSGVYAVWHLGVRPRWLRFGGAADLGVALSRLRALPQIEAEIVHDGVYLAWAPMAVADIPAALSSLNAALRPYLQTLDLPGEIKAVAKADTAFPLPPGTQSPVPPHP